MVDSGRAEHADCRVAEARLLKKVDRRERVIVGAVLALIAIGLAAREGAVTVRMSTEDNPTISTEMFSGGKVSIFVQVDTVERFELACDDPLAAVRCGTEPLVLHPGSRSSWIYNGRQWHLIFLDLGDRESAL